MLHDFVINNMESWRHRNYAPLQVCTTCKDISGGAKIGTPKRFRCKTLRQS